jgi:3-oxoacyl-[acyl-carrier protein] reductase
MASEQFPFAHRVALVTGASGGIGAATARLLADGGADVALTCHGHREDAEQAAEQVRAAGRRARVFRADFADRDVPEQLARQVADELGAVDVLVAGAGAGEQRSWEEVDRQLWDRTLEVNLSAPFFLAQQVLPGMVERGWGRVLFLSSIAALTGGVLGAHYAASKAALHGLTHYLASRTAQQGVTVNAIAPALIGDTRMVPLDPNDPEALPLPIPVGRLGTPEEVADLSVAMLRNGYLTDKVITLDGGLHAS